MNEYPLILGLMCAAISAAPIAAAGAPDADGRRLLRGEFRWVACEPLIKPAGDVRPGDPCIAVKDPSVVFHDGRWHVFITVRGKTGPASMHYLSFRDWKDADMAERHMLSGISEKNYCAPQVFFFRPQKKWYMIYQGAMTAGDKPAYGPAFSTSDDIADPKSWTTPTALRCEKPESAKAWLDFWVICDEASAWLYFTSIDGQMWRCKTDLGAFPQGWSKPELALKGDIFEASHTYRLKGMDKYLTLIETHVKGRQGYRYYKTYVADSLGGKWEPLAATEEKPFAGRANVRFSGAHWTDSFSHGELLREGNDETLTVDPAALRFLIQGVTDADRAGKPYGAIPWRIGILEPDSLPSR